MQNDVPGKLARLNELKSKLDHDADLQTLQVVVSALIEEKIKELTSTLAAYVHSDSLRKE